MLADHVLFICDYYRVFALVVIIAWEFSFCLEVYFCKCGLWKSSMNFFFFRKSYISLSHYRWLNFLTSVVLGLKSDVVPHLEQYDQTTVCKTFPIQLISLIYNFLFIFFMYKKAAPELYINVSFKDVCIIMITNHTPQNNLGILENPKWCMVCYRFLPQIFLGCAHK